MRGPGWELIQNLWLHQLPPASCTGGRILRLRRLDSRLKTANKFNGLNEHMTKVSNKTPGLPTNSLKQRRNSVWKGAWYLHSILVWLLQSRGERSFHLGLPVQHYTVGTESVPPSSLCDLLGWRWKCPQGTAAQTGYLGPGDEAGSKKPKVTLWETASPRPDDLRPYLRKKQHRHLKIICLVYIGSLSMHEETVFSPLI